jgi:phage tail-like protein
MSQSGFARANSYITTNRFYIEMIPDSSIVACFTECSGLSIKVDYETYMEGGDNEQQRIFLKHRSVSEVTFKRGMTDELSFWNWITATTDRRRNIRVLTFNQAGETRQCWTLIGAVPVNWRAPSLQADGTQVAIEELAIACEGLSVSATGGGAATTVSRGSTGLFPSS